MTIVVFVRRPFKCVHLLHRGLWGPHHQPLMLHVEEALQFLAFHPRKEPKSIRLDLATRHIQLTLESAQTRVHREGTPRAPSQTHIHHSIQFHSVCKPYNHHHLYLPSLMLGHLLVSVLVCITTAHQLHKVLDRPIPLNLMRLLIAKASIPATITIKVASY